ncbi:skeletrophin [Penicillium canariense]|uniref:Skeletrophin n=1 Tax=Penicillium canariense TaxID=189055 RepID=A0A9W9IF39_9EURO|nr:skeletrophin [Penicillium canariense]KAJ5175267.1 skeletrophin [Penicillium canariense]
MASASVAAEAATMNADFSKSENKGLQMGQNLGTIEASFYSDSIQGVTIAAGASVYMGEKKTVEDKILDALIAGDAKDRRDIRRAEPGTCEWVFESAPFRDWIQADDPKNTPLYIQGTPGSGKSVLLMFLARELEKRMRLGTPSLSSPTSPMSEKQLSIEKPLSIELGIPGKTLAAACFCDDKVEQRRTPIGIFRTLLYKTFLQNRTLVKYAQKHLQNIEELDTMTSDPDEFQSLDVLQKILEEVGSDPDVEITYFIIDGLDQCGPHLPAVLRLITDLSDKVNARSREQGQNFRLRCIISDRGSQIVSERMLPGYTIDLSKDNESDINAFTNKRVTSIQEYRRFPENIHKFTTSLLKENCKGMFMWLSLVLDDLGTWDGSWTETKVKERLHSVPPDVEAFYKAMLERQSRESASRLQTLLMWVYFADRPLTLQELDVVLTLQEGKGQVGGLSSKEDVEALRSQLVNNWGALFVVHQDTVHLAHQSVKDFLSNIFSTEGESEYPRYGMAIPQAHRRVASICLAYLMLEEVQKREVPKPPVNDNGLIEQSQLMAVRQQYLEGFSFLQYSVESLGHHLRESQIQEEVDVKGMEEFFAADSAALLTWVKSYDLLKRWTSDSGFSSSTSLLFVAARLNLPWLADKATTWGKSITSLPSAICAPDMSGWSAIHIAADSEAVNMVAWLLKNGAMVDAETVGISHPGRTALHFAASKRPNAGLRMVKELLNGRAKATAQTRQGGNTPLHYAVGGRSTETVKALLEKGADPNVTNGSGVSPLHKAAAIPGLEELVEAMIKGGADPNKKTSVGTVSAVRGLVSLKASRDLMQTYYAVNNAQTALHIATKAKDAEHTLDVLLKGGADVNSKDSAGRTSLHLAMVKMDPEAVMKQLVGAGADVNARDVDGKTPLLVLLTAIALQVENQPQLLSEPEVQESRKRLIDILMSAGADPSAEAKDKQTPISCARQAKLQWAVERLTPNSTDEKRDIKESRSDEKPAIPPKDTVQPESAKKGFLESQASKWIPKRPKW